MSVSSHSQSIQRNCQWLFHRRAEACCSCNGASGQSKRGCLDCGLSSDSCIGGDRSCEQGSSERIRGDAVVESGCSISGRDARTRPGRCWCGQPQPRRAKRAGWSISLQHSHYVVDRSTCISWNWRRSNGCCEQDEK